MPRTAPKSRVNPEGFTEFWCSCCKQFKECSLFPATAKEQGYPLCSLCIRETKNTR